MVKACNFIFLNTQKNIFKIKCGANNEFNLAVFFLF